MVSYLQLTPNMGAPKRFSIAHWKALGENSPLAINQVVVRSYGS